jgi:SAM-dependent methyltransferase
VTVPDPVGVYERHADAWAAARGPELVIERAWLERFTMRLETGASVLDAGCGHGDPLGRALLAGGFELTGVDGSAALVEQARRRLPRGRWSVGDLRDLELGRTFDGVLAWCSLFHLPGADQPGVIRRLGEHARPGTVLLMTTGPEPGEAIGEFGGEPLFHASLAPDEYRAALATAGFEVLDHRVADPDCGELTVWLAHRVPGPADESADRVGHQ